MKNNLLNDSPVYTGRSRISTHLHLYNYSAEGCNEAIIHTFKELPSLLEKDEIHWIQIHGLNHTQTIREICEYYHIDFLVLQDILNPNHPPKIEEYPNFNLAILKLLHLNKQKDEIISQQVCLIQGKNFLLTFLEQEGDFFDPVAQALYENILHIREHGTDYLLSVLLNQIIGSYNALLNGIDEALEDMEEELLNITNNTDIGARIQSYRRQYLVLKKVIFPLKEQYSKLQRSQSSLIKEENKIYFNDVYDHLQLALQTVEICREILSSLVDLYISNNDLRMNNIMKRLTVVSTIFIPLTFIVGVWGMNFKFMPELDWEYSYFGAWFLMVIIAIAVSVYLKKKDWY